MNQTKLKETLIAGGDAAFIALAEQIQYLFDSIHFFMTRFPAKSPSLENKHHQLQLSLRTLGGLPYQLADVIRKWKHDEPRVLSKLGVELELLNEISATITVTAQFFAREGIDLAPFSDEKAQYACFVLGKVNAAID
jgi:hypothetical protein